MCKTILLTLAVLALVVVAAAPAAASSLPTPPAAAVQTACPPSLDLLVTSTAAVCPAATPAVTSVQPEFLAQKGFRGFCRCGCSPIRDCNTSADCGGGACSPGISCC
jgi:hypothetical protein